MRQLIFKMVREEFQPKIEQFGGDKKFIQSIAISWRYDSRGNELQSENDFVDMAQYLQQVCKSSDAKNQEANTSDLESSFVSIKFNGSQNVKIVRLTASAQENKIVAIQPESVTTFTAITPRESRKANIWSSDSKTETSRLNFLSSSNLNQMAENAEAGVKQKMQENDGFEEEKKATNKYSKTESSQKKRHSVPQEAAKSITLSKLNSMDQIT